MKAFEYSHRSPKGKVIKRLTRRNRRLLRNTTEGYDQTSWHACVVTQEVVPATAENNAADVFVTDEFDDSRVLGAIVAFMASSAAACRDRRASCR